MNFGVRFGALVKRYREAQGLTGRELALHALGDHAKSSRISELENGKVARPLATTIDALVGYLAIPIEEVDTCRDPVDPPTVEGADPIVLDAMVAQVKVLKAQLAARDEEIQAALADASPEERETLAREAAEVTRKLSNAEGAVAERDKRIAELEARLGNAPDEAAAREALEGKDLAAAREAFERIAAETDLEVKKNADAHYALGQIAEEEVRWADAALHYLSLIHI